MKFQKLQDTVRTDQKWSFWKEVVDGFHWFSVILFSRFGFMVFNATFNNISVISWRSVLLVEETWVPGENHQPVESHIMLYQVHHTMSGVRTDNIVVIGTECIGSCKSNYHMTMTAPFLFSSQNYPCKYTFV
jgi:hypothetical protein